MNWEDKIKDNLRAVIEGSGVVELLVKLLCEVVHVLILQSSGIVNGAVE